MHFLENHTFCFLLISSLYQLRVQATRFLKVDFDLSTRSHYRSTPYAFDGKHTSISCAKVCLKDADCKEYGYRKDDNKCVLFRTSGPSKDLQSYVGFKYYVMVSDADTNCNSTALGATDGAWTVIQRRNTGQVGFFRGWKEYKNGFGCQDGEFWLGLEKIHELTKNDDHKLRIVLNDIHGYTCYVEYTRFLVGDEASSYMLNVSGYTPFGVTYGSTIDRGASCQNFHVLDSNGDNLAIHNGQPFKTLDREVDRGQEWLCSYDFTGAWWYYSCHASNLNGLWGSKLYGKGIVWYTFRGHHESMAATKMMIMKK